MGPTTVSDHLVINPRSKSSCVEVKNLNNMARITPDLSFGVVGGVIDGIFDSFFFHFGIFSDFPKERKCREKTRR